MDSFELGSRQSNRRWILPSRFVRPGAAYGLKATPEEWLEALRDEDALAGGFDWKTHNGPHCKVRHY